jgi:hypothetical protein
MFQAHCLFPAEKKDKHVVSGLWFMKPYKSDFMKPIHFIVEHIFFFGVWKNVERSHEGLLGTGVKGFNGVMEAFSIKILISKRV